MRVYQRAPFFGGGGKHAGRVSMQQSTAASQVAPTRILVVEDDHDIRASLQSILIDEGYLVQACGNGREALSELASAVAPDLIILDLMMPVMDGWQFRIH